MSMHSTSAPLRDRHFPLLHLAFLALAAGVAALAFAAFVTRDRTEDPASTTQPPAATPVTVAVHSSAPQPVIVYLTNTAEEAVQFEEFLAQVTSETGGDPSPVEVLVLPMGSAEEARIAQRTIALLELDDGAGRVRVVDMRRRQGAASEPDAQAGSAGVPDAGR